MFMNVFAVEMALGISEGNLKKCLERSQQPEGFKIDEDFERNYLLFLLLTSCCMDYIKETGLKEGEPLHQLVVTKLAGLANVLTCSFEPYTYESFSKVLAKGKIPFERANLSWANEGRVELPKLAVDHFAQMAKDVIDPSYEERTWESFDAMCKMAGQNFLDTANIFSSSKHGEGVTNSDGNLDFDL